MIYNRVSSINAGETLVSPAFVTILSTGISWQMRFSLKGLVALNTSNVSTDKVLWGES